MLRVYRYRGPPRWGKLRVGGRTAPEHDDFAVYTNEPRDYGLTSQVNG